MVEAPAINVASNLVSKLGEYLFAPIGRQFGYVLCFKSYIEDLENGVKELKTARERVQSSVDEAMYNGKCVYVGVEDWLKSVEEETGKANNLLKRGESAKNACFYGWLPNPAVRHPIGRKVKKITKVIQGLREKSPNDKVSHNNPPIGMVPATPSAERFIGRKEDVLESRAKITEDVMKALGDHNVSVIGVYGPGGVGKSKLSEDIKSRVMKESLFDFVAVANVSRNQDLKRIQEEIADALGLHSIDEKTALGRAERLRERLESNSKKNVLIILDNLWEKLELKEVGIPCGDNNKVRGCKLLLTSRNRDVLRTDMSSDREFQLDVLEHGEARRLFERTVGDRVNDPEIEPWVDGVVKNCGGLPLLIVPLAKRLKHRDLAAWRNASTNRDLSKVKSMVELSYNDIKEERIKSLFLVRALASGSISVRDSLIYCMGLELFKEFSLTIQNARDRLMDDLHSLQDYSLLIDNDDMRWFRMHDEFVDVAISIASTEWKALVGKKGYGFKVMSKDELKKCTVISFPFVGIDELPEKLECPNLRMLLLFEENSSLKISESFFKSMEKLQVLDLTGFSFTSLPPSIEFLENLKSLSLDHCNMEDVTVLGKLKGLHFLSLFNSAINRLPKEIGELTNLRFLDLTGCFSLKIIDPGVLENLVNLEELYIDGFCQWEAEDEAPRSNASLAELKNMKRLRTLYITIPHSTNLSSDLPFGNLNEHKIQIGSIERWWDEDKESRTLKLKLDSGNLLHEVWMQECLGRTRDLRLDGLQDDRDSIHDLCTKGFQELKHLSVKNNRSFQYVVDSTQCPAFTRLESLVLENLNNLEKICCDCLALESFKELKIVKVKNCGEIKHLFPSSMTRIFLQLEEIEITGCHLMQQIVTDTEVNEHIDEIDDDDSVKSCKLRRLTLQNLPEMTSFYNTEDHSVVFLDGQQVSLPQLESLTLSQLPKLKEIWNSQFPSNVGNLKLLKVEDCTLLWSIIPSNLLIKLQNLKAITVERCQLIREVFDLEGLTAKGVVEILPQLTRLTLSELPSLERIWNKNSRRALCFQNLRALKVQNCENLRFLFSSSMAKSLGQINEIEIANCKLMEEVIDVQEEESEEAATTNTLKFPLLTSLSLKELPNLKTFSYGKYCTHYPSLTRLRISGCPKMMTFSSFEGKQPSMTADTSSQQAFGCINSSLSLPVFFNQNVIFPKLEKLALMSCGLMKIWLNELSEESFSKLASITVRDCANLSHIFPSTLVDRFPSLEMITVVECTSLEALIEHVVVDTKKGQNRLVFSKIKKAELRELPRLNAFVTSSTKVTLSLSSLTNVSLRNCHGLISLFTNDTARTLEKLEMLDVSNCDNMQEIIAVQEGEQQKLKAVKLSHLRTLKLCSLKSLISFSSGSCAYEFPSLGNLSIVKCTKLKAFILRLPEPSVEMMEEGSAGFNESPYSLFDEKILFPSLEELKLSSLCQLKRIWHNQLYRQSFCKLTSLTVELCENLLHVFPSNSMDRLQSLNKIEVVGCPSLEELFEPVSLTSEKRQKPLVLCALQTMKLLNLPMLRDILKSNCKVTLAFPSLMEVSVSHCHSLSYLFSSDTARTLDKLVVLDITHCNNLRGIIGKEEENGETVETLEFHQLSTLKLGDLENLISFHSASCDNDGLCPLFDEKVLFPSLEELKLSSMSELKRIWHNQFHERSFCKLASFTLELCENLSHVFPSNSIDRLLSLNKLKVVGCPSLEALFEPVNLNAEKRQKPLVLSALKEVKLLNLPRLRDIWNSDCNVTLAFPSLTEVNVRRCHSLPYLFSSATTETLDKLVVLDVSCCNNMWGIIAMEEGKGKTVETLKFNQLSTLKVSDLENLISFRSASCANDGLHPLFDEKLAFTKLQELHIEQVQHKELWNDKIPVESFCRLKVLKVKQCQNLMNVIPSFMWRRLLHCMKSLTVEKCPRLRNLFTMSMAKSLGELQYLGLGGCGEMEYVVAREEEKLEQAADRIVISHLVTLHLHNMPKLKSFCQGKHILKWPSLEKFTVEDCQAVEVIFGYANCRKLEGSILTQQPLLLVEKVEFPSMETMKISHMNNVKKIWLDELASTAISKLKKLTVEYCEKLSSIFSSDTILTRFRNLEKLKVTNCDSLEVVFQIQDLNMSEAHSTSTFQLRKLKLKRLPKMRHIWRGHPGGTLTFERLRCLEVENCESLKSLFPVSVAKSMTQLEELTVLECGVEEIVVAEDGVGTSAGDLFFPQLTDLRLLDLPELRRFYGNSPTSIWPLLKQLRVRHCGKMRPFSFGKTTGEAQHALFSFEKVIPQLKGSTLTREDVLMMQHQHYIFGNLKELSLACYHDENAAFPSDFLLRRFPNLEELVVICSSFEEIFPEDASGYGGASLKALGNLKQLWLNKLCNLRQVWKDGSLMTEILKQIEYLNVWQCPNLSIVFPSPTSFQSLTQLHVEDCVGLVHMGTCSAMTSLVHLTWLTLKNCGAMKDVVTDDADGTEEISFPELEELILDGLPSLESFSPTNCAFKFPSLERVVVTQCPKINIFCKGALRTPNLDKVLLSDGDGEGRWEGDLNATIRALSA